MSNFFAENIYTAPEAAALAQGFTEEQRTLYAAADITRTEFGLPKLDAYLNPFMAGDLITVLGRPQNGKSLIAMYLLDKKLRDIVGSGVTDKVVILVTLEVSVERSVIYQMARQAGISAQSVIRGDVGGKELEALDMAALRIGTLPLFIIGHSTRRAADGRRKRPDLTTENISLCIDYIMNEYRSPVTGEYMEPVLVVIDYLQRIHKAKNFYGDRSEHMLTCVDWAKDLAIWAGSPVVLAAQASREVDSLVVRLPQMIHGQWTSNIEQTSDFSLSVWMIKTGIAARSNWEKAAAMLGLSSIPFDKGIMLMQALKQKDGDAGRVFPIHVDPAVLRISELSFEQSE